MAFFLGVDAGGTKAEFVLGDETRELGRARMGTLKRMKTDAETAEAHLRSALDALQEVTAVDPREVTRTCVGTAGETVPLVTAWLRQAFARHVGGELLLVGDVEIALDSVFAGGRGVLVLAGTGSNVAGRTSSGEVVRAGGWGPALADQGSGHFLGLEGLRRGFLARDEGRPTGLLEAARKFWRLATIEELVEYANANPAPDYSRLAPAVVTLAEQGDAVAHEVIEQAGRDLAMLAGLVMERMRTMESAGFELPVVAVAGSILERVAGVRDAMTRALEKTYPGIAVLKKPADPAAGALWKARRG
jgi:glucosamine kinase